MLLLSLSANLYFVEIVGVYALVLLSLLRAGQIAGILKVALAAAFFTFVLLLPSAMWGNFSGALVISAKVLISITMVKLLSETTEWDSLLTALRAFRIPNLFILVLDITVRYIVLLAQMALAMTTSLKLRSVGRNRAKTASLGGIAGTLFLRSKMMAEGMHEAMECRGFTGEYRVARRIRGPRALDFLLAAVTLGLVVAFALLGGYHHD